MLFSSFSPSDAYLRSPYNPGCGQGRCAVRMACTEGVRGLLLYKCITLSSPYCRKMGKKLSFFGLRDSFGTTQLIADARVCGIESLTALREIPAESTVLVKGTVLARPESQRRSVRSYPFHPCSGTHIGRRNLQDTLRFKSSRSPC